MLKCDANLMPAHEIIPNGIDQVSYWLGDLSRTVPNSPSISRQHAATSLVVEGQHAPLRKYAWHTLQQGRW
jgi:hypothetical protein